MCRLLVVAGLRLDRAWPELGPYVGEVIRQWSAEVLARTVEVARDREADGLVVLGDLFDRRSVLPSTVEYAAAVLESFDGPVLVVPGRQDWYGDATPYTYGAWPANTTIARSAAVTPVLRDAPVWASAWTAPLERSLDLNGLDVASLLLRPSVSEPAAVAAQLPGTTRLITSGEFASSGQRHVVVPAAVMPRPEAGLSALLDTASTEPPDWIEVGASPLQEAVMDVGGVLEDRELFNETCRHASGDAPIVIRFTGTLPAAVLPPSLIDRAWPTHVVLDESALEYTHPSADASDRTALGEFLRTMAGVGADDRQRHIATALALQAMTETES